MGMAMRGITHCYECGTTLRDGEFHICDSCRQKEKEEQQKQQIQQNKKKEKILNILANMNDYEIKALEEFIHRIGKEYKKRETEKEIERLQKTLEE